MTALLELPYFRDSKDLPAPLPTKSEILTSTNILKGNEPWAFRKVVIVNEVFIAKYGQAKGQIEGGFSRKINFAVLRLAYTQCGKRMTEPNSS